MTLLFQTSTLQNSKPLVQIGSLVYLSRQISNAPRLDPHEAAKRKRSGERTYGGAHGKKQEAVLARERARPPCDMCSDCYSGEQMWQTKRDGITRQEEKQAQQREISSFEHEQREISLV